MSGSNKDTISYVEIKCHLDATEVFIADLIACSTCFGHHYAHHQSSRVLNSGCCLWYFVLWFSSCWSGVELRVMCSVCRMLQQLLYNTLELLMMGIVVPETCRASNKICTKTSVASSWHFIPTYFHILHYVFCIYLRTNSDLCHLHHKLTGFYNRDEKCLQRGTSWVFQKSSLSFVFKGLINVWLYIIPVNGC